MSTTVDSGNKTRYRTRFGSGGFCVPFDQLLQVLAILAETKQFVSMVDRMLTKSTVRSRKGFWLQGGQNAAFLTFWNGVSREKKKKIIGNKI